MRGSGLAILALFIAFLVLPGCRPSRGDGVVSCTPGESLNVGCSVECGLGSCSGDPRIRICDGTAGTGACSSSGTGSITEADDSSCGGLCPFTSIVCPPSGSIAVVVAGSCDWDVERTPDPGGIETCVPGTTLEIGCAEGCSLGACSGDPVLKVCDASLVPSIAACLATSDSLSAEVLGRNDDSSCGSRCPFLSFTCPPSGQIVVAHRPFSSGGSYTCDWALRAP